MNKKESFDRITTEIAVSCVAEAMTFARISKKMRNASHITKKYKDRIRELIAEAERRERERIDQKVRTDISTALATAERTTYSFDPKHPRCPRCGNLMEEIFPYTWECDCSPTLPPLRLSIG